jgi:hypothetical protein
MSSLLATKGNQYALVPVKYFVLFPISNLKLLAFETFGYVSAKTKDRQAKVTEKEKVERVEDLIVKRDR